MKFVVHIFAALALVATLAMAAEEATETETEEKPAEPAEPAHVATQQAALERYWLAAGVDHYPQETNSKKKPIHLDAKGYEAFVVGADGKLATDRPWFVTFINPKLAHCNMIQESLHHLAYYYQGDIQFAFVNRVLEEKLSHTYEVYEQDGFVPRSFLIDKDGMAYTFPLVLPAINTTTDWIDSKKYKNSPLKFKAPAILSDLKMYWAYAKKDARQWYTENLLDKVEDLLRKTKISYVVDLDPMDFDTARPYQKMDRQIILILGIIGMTLESIWDWYFAAQTPAQKKIKKSFLDSSSSAADVKPDGPERLKKEGAKKSRNEKLD